MFQLKTVIETYIAGRLMICEYEETERKKKLNYTFILKLRKKEEKQNENRLPHRSV